jgi:DNA-binding response OmpR family regulator
MPDTNAGFRPSQLDQPSMQVQAGGATKAVLVADADFKEGGAIRNSLEGSGYDVSVWIDGADARERLRARNFEVVVVSTNLKQHMDGLFEDLRPRKIPPKVILIADEDEGDAAARCFLRTVVVVNRPFKVSEISDIVEHLIGPPA